MQTELLAGHWNDQELAQQLNKSTRTVKRWRAQRRGPPVTWLGNRALYKIESVRAWLASMEQPQPKRQARG